MGLVTTVGAPQKVPKTGPIDWTFPDKGQFCKNYGLFGKSYLLEIELIQLDLFEF